MIMLMVKKPTLWLECNLRSVRASYMNDLVGAFLNVICLGSIIVKINQKTDAGGKIIKNK